MNDIADPTLETNVLPDLPTEDEHDEKPSTTRSGEETSLEEKPVTEKPDDLRESVKELAGIVRQQSQPKEQVRQPTQEEIADFWKVYDPESTDKEFFRKWFRLNPDATPEEVQQAKELFAGVQKGLMRQAVTAARNYIQMARAEIDETYGPLKEYVQEAKQEATRGRFYGDYPALEDQKFQKIIDATARSLDNKTFADESAYFKALAEGAADSIKAILPDFDLGAKPNKPTQPGKTPRLPRSSAGSGGGAGKGAAHDALKPTGKRNDIDSLDEEGDV